MNDNDSKDKLIKEDSSSPAKPDNSTKENVDKETEIDAKKSILEVQKIMKDMIIRDPLKEMREKIKTYYIKDPLKEMRDRMKAMHINDPLKEMQAKMKALYIKDPFKEMQDRMKIPYIEDPLKEMEDRIKAPYIENPLKEMQDRIKSLYTDDPLKEMQDRIKALYIDDPLKEMREKIKALHIEDPLNEIRKTILKYHKITNAYKNVFLNSVPVNTFEEAYQEVLSNFIAVQSQSGGDTTEAVNLVAEEIDNQTKTFQISKLSLEFYINFLVALIFFLYSLQLSKQSESRIMDSINNSKGIIIERLNELREPEKQETYYVVERAVNLRIKPTTKNSEVITVLYPNQKVRLVSKKGKWIKVEFYNHILDIHENGWCFKKYLKRIK